MLRHARLVLSFDLLQLSLLVGSQQLIKFVVDASFLHGKLSLDLGLLGRQHPYLGLIECAFHVLAKLRIDLVLLLHVSMGEK